MLFAGWEVRIVKNRDRGQHFRARGHSFPRTDPRQANNMFIFFPAVNWFYRSQMGLFTQLCH